MGMKVWVLWGCSSSQKIMMTDKIISVADKRNKPDLCMKMNGILQGMKQFILKGKLTKRVDEFSIDLYFLTKGLKPTILWDFGKVDIEKLSSLRSLLGKDLVIVEVVCDYFICFKSSLVTLLNNCLLNLPVLIDVSETLSAPVEAADDVRNMVTTMVESFLGQVTGQVDDSLHVIDIQQSWNLSTLFGLLLGFPVVYYFDPSGDNCLSNRDLTIWRVGSGHAWPVSFSVPTELEQVVENKVKQWWEQLGQSKEWSKDFHMGELVIVSKKCSVNMPVVVL